MKNTRNIKLSEVLEELYFLRDENEELKVDNDFLTRQNAALKLSCSEYSSENMALKSEVGELRLSNILLGGKITCTNLPLKKKLKEEITNSAPTVIITTVIQNVTIVLILKEDGDL